MTPKKYALTKCIEEARSEIICSVDADIQVPPTWVRSMVAAFASTTGIVAGFAAMEADDWFASLQALDFLGLMSAGAGAIQRGLTWSASGMNLAYRRALFAAVDGFRPVARRLSGDDVYLLQAIGNLSGYRAVFQFDPGSFVKTKAQPSWKSFWAQRVRWAADGRYQWRTRPGFFLFLLSAFIFDLGLMLGPWIGGITWSWWWSLLGAKAIVEGLMLYTGTGLFQQRPLLKWFPLWFILQIPYVVIMGVATIHGRYSWKGTSA